MKNTTPKRIAASILTDAIDMIRSRDFEEVETINDKNRDEVLKQLEKILAPIEDRMETITKGQNHLFE